MGYTTKRITEFRGINRSLRPGAIDLAYAFNAENIDINGGRLANNIGNYRCIFAQEDEKGFEIGRPNFLYVGSSDIYLISRGKYCKLLDITTPSGSEEGKFEPKSEFIENVVRDSDLVDAGLNILGVGRSTVLANINNVDCLIASGMLDTGTGYWTYRDFYVDGTTAKTAVYYLGSETPTPSIHCRQFGSGLTMMKDKSITEVGSDSDGHITYIKLYDTTMPIDKVVNRAVLDGIWLFHEQIGNTTNEDAYDSAFMWLKVTSVTQSGGGNVVFNVETTHLASEITTGNDGDYVIIRGECSDMTVTFMTMFYGRLFAAAHRANADHPRRLYWSCLPGDGRTIEDWTQTDVSVDTSGGHVDIGDPSDGYITGLVACGSTLLIFTQTRLWRMYGTAPSNYTLELVGELDSPRVSNPVEIKGVVYWLAVTGIQYYNGSYIATVDDNGNMKNVLEAFPQYMQDVFMYSTVHAKLFDNSIMFAIDVTAHKSRGVFVNTEEVNECWLIRYDLETGNIIEYRVPADRFRQQFIDVITRNFGTDNGNKVLYETRLIQTVVHKEDESNPLLPEYMTMTQWHHWNDQEFGWWDESKPHSVWQTGWTDMQSPEAVKKLHTICLRGSGEFTLTIESEVNKEVLEVKMPDDEQKVKELTPHYAEGRSFRFTIESEKPFSIEPYMTLLFEYGSKR